MTPAGAPAALILRPYQPSDFEMLVKMDRICFSPSIAYGRREMKFYLQSPGSRCIVAELPDAIAGFILTERAGEMAHIITLDVLPEHRRKAVGSRLLEAAEGDAAAGGATLIYLETALTNKAAIALWKKHGYRETGTIENYYGHAQHAYAMQKRLERNPKDK